MKSIALRSLSARPRLTLSGVEIPTKLLSADGNDLKKLSMRDKDLNEYSRETAQMFYEDACKAGFQIDCNAPGD
jgi:hypothetical protein